jgi:hypothetical protein
MIPFKQQRHGRGQALVEFALVIPLFLLIIFGLVDLGRAVFVNNSLAEAARDGARYGSVQARAFNDATRSDVEDWIVDRLDGVPDPTASVTCEPAHPDFGCTVDDVLVVTVSSNLDMITPVIGQIIGTLELEGRSEALVNN